MSFFVNTATEGVLSDKTILVTKAVSGTWKLNRSFLSPHDESLLSEKLINSLQNGEHLKVSIDGELSQFIRFSQSKVRQSGLVDDASLSITLIYDERSCSGSFTLGNNDHTNYAT